MFDTYLNNNKRIQTRVLETIRNYSLIDFLYRRWNHDQVDFFEVLEDKPPNVKLFTSEWNSYEYEE